MYYSDKWQVLEERVGSDVKKSYVWSPAYVDAMIARDRDTDANGTLDERLYVIHDANYNAVALVDTSGAVVERFAYDSFGVFFVLTPSWGAQSSSNYDWVYLFQSGRWDAEPAGYNFRNRELSPTLGRWFQLDPIGFSCQDVNLYRYEANRPTSATDALGLMSIMHPSAKGVLAELGLIAARIGLNILSLVSRITSSGLVLGANGVILGSYIMPVAYRNPQAISGIGDKIANLAPNTSQTNTQTATQTATQPQNQPDPIPPIPPVPPDPPDDDRQRCRAVCLERYKSCLETRLSGVFDSWGNNRCQSCFDKCRARCLKSRTMNNPWPDRIPVNMTCRYWEPHWRTRPWSR